MAKSAAVNVVKLEDVRVASLVEEGAAIDAQIKALQVRLADVKAEVERAAVDARKVGDKSVRLEAGQGVSALVKFASSPVSYEGEAEVERLRKALGDRFPIIFKLKVVASLDRDAGKAFCAADQTAQKRERFAEELAERIAQSESEEKVSVQFDRKEGK